MRCVLPAAGYYGGGRLVTWVRPIRVPAQIGSSEVRLVKIGLGNVNSTVGAFAANGDRCIEQARGMAAEGVTVGLFPEQVIGGYPPEDLIQWQGFVDNQWTKLE